MSGVRFGSQPQNSVDIALVASRVAGIAKRLCEVETWRRLADDLISDGGDDIIKLEDRVDDHAETIAAQAKQIEDLSDRVMRLELVLGMSMQRSEVEG